MQWLVVVQDEDVAAKGVDTGGVHCCILGRGWGKEGGDRLLHNIFTTKVFKVERREGRRSRRTKRKAEERRERGGGAAGRGTGGRKGQEKKEEKLEGNEEGREEVKDK